MKPRILKRRITDFLEVMPKAEAVELGYELLVYRMGRLEVDFLNKILTDHSKTAAVFILVANCSRGFDLWRRGFKAELICEDAELRARNYVPYAAGRRPETFGSFLDVHRAIESAYWRMVGQKRIVHRGREQSKLVF